MMRFSRLFLLSTLTLAAGAVACGGDGDGSGPSNGAKLSSLSESETVALCKEFEGENAKITEQQCTLSGLNFEILGFGTASCEEFRDDCIVDLAIDCEAKADPEQDLSDCDATVGEARKCHKDSVAMFEKAFNGLSCDSDLQSFEDAEEPELPASCAVLAEKCPDEFGDDEDEFSSKGIRRFAPRARR